MNGGRPNGTYCSREQNVVSTCVHVALIDDVERRRMALARLLSSAGFQPAAFASAEEFLTHANDLAFDCVLLDIHLPGQSGLDLLRVLRRNGERTPVVLLIAEPDRARHKDIRQAGVSCLVMPPDDVTLFRAIRNAIDSSADSVT